MMRICATAACLALALVSVASPVGAATQKVQKLAMASPRAAAHKLQKPAAAKAAKAKAPKPPEEPLVMPPVPEGMTQVIDWVIASGDNGGLPFMVIDKVAAQVIAFDGDGQFKGATAALFGITPGDDSSPGVGDRELSDIAVEERTTPAGRFVARFGTAYGNHKVLWVDYETSISLHPVMTANKSEHRLQRLNSPTPDDNRITFGCINVPPAFYQKIVVPLFKRDIGVVYVLPEVKTLTEVFPAFQARQRQEAAR